MPGDDQAEGLAVYRKAAMFAVLFCEGTACLNFCCSQRCRDFSWGRDAPAQLHTGRVLAALPSLLLESFLLLTSLYFSSASSPCDTVLF